ncbi:hypothetical protein [Polaribacter atrinae]|uniref:hypothetical protein n=1 Tax=Polaribacter atrinae TaxID=1333662 RepID=UPI0030F99988
MKALTLLVLLFSFSQCGSTKFENKIPFTIHSAHYKNWTGGQPGVHGINVQIQLKEKSNINFDSLYFRNKVAKVEFKNATLIIANYNTSNKKPSDVILHLDPKKEVQNKLPTQETFPFELSENEAVLTYQANGKTTYYKIKEIKKRESKPYIQMQ